MKVYISGPMTGYVDHNFPAFHAAADHLRGKGYEVVNPAEMDDPSATHEELAAIPHWWYLRRDIRALMDCDAIYLLPGWRWSKGANLEATVAAGCGIDRLEPADAEIWRTFEGEPVTEDTVGEKADPFADLDVKVDPTLPPNVVRVLGNDGSVTDIRLGEEKGDPMREYLTADGPVPMKCATAAQAHPLPMREYLATYGNEIDRKIQRHHRDGD